MREMYKHSKSSNPLMSFVLNTQSLDSLISGMKYMDQVNDANVDAVRELSDMQTELEAEKDQAQRREGPGRVREAVRPGRP